MGEILQKIPKRLRGELTAGQRKDIAVAEAVGKRQAEGAKAQRAERRQELFLRGTGATKTWTMFIGITLLALFVISPAALGFLQILSEIPEWGFYAIIGIAVLIFILRRRK